MGSVRFAKIDVMVSTKKTRGNLSDGLRKKTKDQRDGFSKQSWNLRDGFGAVPGNRGDGFIKIRRDRDDELCQNSRRRTCKRQEEGKLNNERKPTQQVLLFEVDRKW